MHRLWYGLRARARAVFSARRRDEELAAELHSHLAHERERLERAGLSPEAARQQAARAFGAVGATAEACRDARGRVWLDTLQQDARYAWRTARRAPLASLTIVATVALGLGLVTAVFTIFNGLVLRPDAVREPDALYAVERRAAADGTVVGFSRIEFEALRRETDVFVDAFATSPEVDVWVDGIRMEGPLVTGNFFAVLGVGAARGRTFVDEDERAGRRTLVLSHRAWVTHFAADPTVIGRTVLVNGTACTVIGVMPETFRGLAVAAPDFWVPLEPSRTLRRADPNAAPASDLAIVGRLRAGVSRGATLGQLSAWQARFDTQSDGEAPRAALTLEPRTGAMPQPFAVLVMFLPLFFAFGLILILGCANVANLLLARGVARQREIGIRLATGASRSRVVRQLVTEGLLLALVAAALGLGVARLVLAAAVYAITSTFQPGFGQIRLTLPSGDWRVVVFAIVAAIAATLCFALAPARQATRIDLVRVMRGESSSDVRPGRARHLLIGLQVAVSMLLLTCAAVFLRGAWSAASVDPGIRTRDVVAIWLKDETRREATLSGLAADAAVSTIAASWPANLGGRPAMASGIGPATPVTYQLASPEYFDVLGIGLVRGRGFDQSERQPDAGVAVVSETVARTLWPGTDALGSVLRLDATAPPGAASSEPPRFEARSFVVVGIARDHEGFRLLDTQAAAAGVYLPTDVTAAGTTLSVRVAGDVEQARRTLADRLAAIDPAAAEVTTLLTMTRLQAYLLAVPFWLTMVLGALALAITLSGLFSVLSYLVERRSREIGVRMALGATRGGIVRLVLAQLARPVVGGVVIGAGCIAGLGAALLATPAAAPISATVNLLDPVAYLLSLLCTMLACLVAGIVPALRGSRTNPVTALRLE